MITKARFGEINNEVKGAIESSFDALKRISQNNYITFLADGEFRKEHNTDTSTQNPYVIDYQIDHYKDETRLKFLTQFLSLFYSFPTEQLEVDDNEQRIHMELMIYSHMWEAKPLLKRLYRLAHLINGEDYNWDVAIPDMGKHTFIREDIRSLFLAKADHIGEVIKKGFHTSLRNAFAHSEYVIDTRNLRLILDNYNGASWELRNVPFNDWSERFVYSALLSFYLLDYTYKRRQSLVDEFSTDTFTIKHPSRNRGINDTKIKYRREADSFSFVQ